MSVLDTLANALLDASIVAVKRFPTPQGGGCQCNSRKAMLLKDLAAMRDLGRAAATPEGKSAAEMFKQVHGMNPVWDGERWVVPAKAVQSPPEAAAAFAWPTGTYVVKPQNGAHPAQVLEVTTSVPSITDVAPEHMPLEQSHRVQLLTEIAKGIQELIELERHA